MNAMEPRPLMKCGHAANATNSRGEPSCVICIGIDPGAEQIDPNPPSMEGRKARCTYCKRETKSDTTKLAFFEHHPKAEFDGYYCGCLGWD